jgi:hypothetical protein
MPESEIENAANQRVIRAEMKVIAIKAGMVDLDGLKLIDTSKLKLNDADEVEGADELMAAMKEAKPYLFNERLTSSSTGDDPPRAAPQKPKKVSDMTDAERKADAKRRGFDLRR